MKNVFRWSAILIIILGSNTMFAQDDDVPYLSDEDIAAIEMILPDDIPAVLQGSEREAEANEISRLNASQTIYHLLILERTHCSSNSDITDINSREILYKFKHGTNGYLIAIYRSSQGGPVFPHFPDRSRILVNLMTARKNTMKEYIDSSAFRRFVTSRRIILQMQEVLGKI